jgi:hypothetical protein
MKDKLGLYYYPFPSNKQVRMYVREGEGEIWFRMWNAADEALWDDHGWIPYGAVEQATAMFDSKSFDPERAYDLVAAKQLLKEEQGNASKGPPRE